VNFPIEPNAEARQSALALREVYVALLSTGFNEEQSMELLKAIILTMGGQR
jgi:hypothetical protein